MSAPANGASRLRLRTRNDPTALADAPNVMKTMENPKTKAKADVSNPPRGAPSLSCSTPIPDSIEIYPGTSGSTQGERNDTSPATNAANAETPIGSCQPFWNSSDTPQGRRAQLKPIFSHIH